MMTLGQSCSSSDSYNVSWKSQQSHISEGLRDLMRQDSGLLTDVTLACEGEYINAHKVVLSLCSSYFKDLFQKNRADKSNTIVILGNVNARNMRYLLRYMYDGKVSLPNRHVDGFLKAGMVLKVGGLAKTSEEDVEQIKPVTLRSSTTTSNRKRSIPTSSQSNAKRMTTSKDQQKDDTENEDEDEDGVEYDYEVANSHPRVKTEPVTDNEENNDTNDGCEMDDDDTNDSTWVSKPSRSKYTVSKRGKAMLKRPLAFSRAKRNRSSVVWKFFTQDPGDLYARCKLCTEQEVQLKTTMGCTTGLLRHLINVHPGVLANAPTVPRYKHSIASASTSTATATTDNGEKPASDAAPPSQSDQDNSSNSNADDDTK